MSEEEKDVLAELQAVSASYTAELQSKMDRLDALLSGRHWATIGSYRETILRNHLSSKLPKRFEVGTGFCLSSAYRKVRLSKQTDILIWDSTDHSPFYRDGDFCIVTPESTKVVLEVKGTLSHAALREAIDNVEQYNMFLDHARRDRRQLKCIFSYQLDDAVKFPRSIFNALHKRCITDTEFPLEERLKWSKQHHELWQLPWVNNVVVLGVGVVSFEKWRVDGEDYYVYAAYKATRKEQGEGVGRIDDTYGFLERKILAELLCPSRIVGRLDRPGIVDALHRNQPNLLDCVGFMPLAVPAAKFRPKQICGLDSSRTADIASLLCKPRRVARNKT